MRLPLDKLQGIKSDLVRVDGKWNNWDFDVLTKELSRSIDCNPVRLDPKAALKKEPLLHAIQRDSKSKVCFCQGYKNNEGKILVKRNCVSGV